MKKFLIISGAFAFFSFFAAIYIALAADWYAYKQPPPQPIVFSHQLHAGQVGLECQFCHEYTDKGPFAGIPSVEKCMSCHANVATDRPEIQKLAAYWDDGEVPEWNRVYSIRIRKHVVFTHKRHIKAGIDCAQCHGEVKYADYPLRRVSSLEMGWCVGCHQQNEASTDCLVCHQ